MTEETYFVCSIKGCPSLVFDEEFRYLGCGEHGQSLVRQVRQFENGREIATFTEKPNAIYGKGGK